MPEPLVLHKTVAFPQAEFDAFINKLELWIAEIPEPDAITNEELKKLSKMGDIKEADAALKVEALKRYNSFLPNELAFSLFMAKLMTYKQANGLEKLNNLLTDKFWGHGILAGADLLKMLSLAEAIATTSATLGNSDAINYLNELDKIKTARAKASKKQSKDTNAAKTEPPKE